MTIWENALPDEALHLGFNLRAIPPANWWVCQTADGLYFYVRSDTYPCGQWKVAHRLVTPDSYQVLYGGVTQEECQQFVADLR